MHRFLTVVMQGQLDNTQQALSAQNDQVPLRNYSCFETDLGELLVLSRL